MNSNSLITSDCNIICDSNSLLLDKETQTSKLYISASKPSIHSKPMPISYDECSNRTSPNILENIQILKDPENPEVVTVIKDTFTEEIIESSNASLERIPANRYLYCREVVKPIQKPEPKSFSIAGSHDNSCNEPAKDNFQTRDENYYDNKYIEKNSSSSNKINMDSKTCRDKSPCKHSESSKTKCLTVTSERKCIKKDKCPDCDKIISKEKGCEKKASKICCKKESTELKKEDSKAKQCLSKCFDLAKQGSVAGLEKIIGIRQTSCPEDNPSYYVINKEPEEGTNHSIKNIPKKSVQGMIDTPSKTLSNIKCAVQNFIGTVYQKTKDTITLVSSESRSHLAESIQPESTYNTKQSKTKLSGKNSKTVSCTYSEFSSDPHILNNVGNSLQNMLPPTVQSIGKNDTNVESTTSYVSTLGIDKLVLNHIESRMNKSSPYDKPSITPEQLDMQPTQNQNSNSMFDVIKTKFYSIFGDTTKKSDDDTSSTS